MSIDPGIKNFAIYTEDIDANSMIKTLKRNPTEKELKELHLCGKSVAEGVGVFCLTDEEVHKNQKKTLSNQARKGLFEVLEKYRDLWGTVDQVVIEQQFINMKGYGGKKGTANMNCIRIAECTYGWILCNYPNIIISYIPARSKYTVNKCPLTIMKKNRKTGKMEERKMEKRDRKKWAVEKGEEILEERENEEELLEKIRGIQGQKLDDIYDGLLLLQAHKWKVKW